MQLRIPQDIRKRYARISREHAKIQGRIRNCNLKLKMISDKSHKLSLREDTKPGDYQRLQKRNDVILRRLQKLTNPKKLDVIQKKWLYLGYLKRHGPQINVLNRVISRAVDDGRLDDATAQQFRDMMAFSVNKGAPEYRESIRSIVEELGRRRIVRPVLRPKK